MTRDEREAHDVLEVAGAAAVQGGEVGAADTGEPRSDPYPVRTRHLERLRLDELERADADALARADERPKRPVRPQSAARSARTASAFIGYRPSTTS